MHNSISNITNTQVDDQIVTTDNFPKKAAARILRACALLFIPSIHATEMYCTNQESYNHPEIVSQISIHKMANKRKIRISKRHLDRDDKTLDKDLNGLNFATTPNESDLDVDDIIKSEEKSPIWKTLAGEWL